MGFTGNNNYYDQFQLQRTWSEQDIKKYLMKTVIPEIKQKKSCTNPDSPDKERLNTELSDARTALKILTDPKKRKEYDNQLEKQVNDFGKQEEKETQVVEDESLNVEVQRMREIEHIMKKAQKEYDKGNYRNVMPIVEPLLSENVVEAWDMKVNALYMNGDYDEALNVLDVGAKAFSAYFDLRWKQVRLRVQLENYQEAQYYLNELIKDFPNNAQAYAEQPYLYLSAEKDELAVNSIKEYLSKYPNDMNYRKYVAYNLIDAADLCYSYDYAAEMIIITEKYDYERCVNLLTIANQIYQDEVTIKELEYAKEFGIIEYDSDNNGTQVLYGAIILGCLYMANKAHLNNDGKALLLFIFIAMFFALLLYTVRHYNYRPRWQAYRDMYRGFREKEDNFFYILAMTPRELVRELTGH